MKNLALFLCLFFSLAYSLETCPANGQLVDPTTQISNQVDANNAETLMGETHQGGAQNQNQSQTSTGPKAYFQPHWTTAGSPYSGYSDKALTGWTPKGLILIEGFNEKNSFLGKGVTDTYSTQLGWSEQSPVGTIIQPFINYQNTGTDLVGTNTAHSSGIGASLNISQKIFPAIPVFCERQPGAVWNIGSTTNDKPCPDNPSHRPDHYPNFDIQTGLNLSFGDTNLATLKHGWSYNTQDAYGISPNLSFDFYRKRTNSDDGLSWLPAAVSIVPTYAYAMAENQSGNSSSSGLLSIQNRNTYLWVLAHEDDCDQTPTESIQLIESNTLFHDTNQEPLTPSTTPIRYQNWARFGLALAYSYLDIVKITNPNGTPGTVKKASLPQLKVEYDYDAFNNQYEAQTVTISANISF